jgi:hypothetical protein
MLSWLIAGFAFTGMQIALLAGTETNQPPSKSVSEQLREQLKEITPVERQAKPKEKQKKHSPKNRPAIERSTPPSEQHVKTKAFREKSAAPSGKPLKSPVAEEHKTKPKARQGEQKKKHAESILTPEEQRLLKSLDNTDKRTNQLEAKDGLGNKPSPEIP